MYLLYCFLIWLGVYTFPALAFFPKLIDSPKTAYAIPILSAFVIYCLSSFLLYYHAFTTTAVLCSALALGVVAVIRLYLNLTKRTFTWTKEDLSVYLFHLVVLLPYFIKLGMHAFDRGDEIYSWNFWAIQHYFQETIDFSHTGAPYPQLFPKLLAFCYHLVGNIDLQLPVKGTLIIFPWAMLTAIAMASPQKKGAYFGAYLLLLFYVLAIVGLEQFFNDGYADPLMTSALIVSVALFWQGVKSSDATLQFSFWAVIAAITAALSKQPGLLWAMVGLPLLLVFSATKDQRKIMIGLSLISLLGGAFWLLGEGREFHHNRGVIWLSTSDRDGLAQLGFAMKRYFVEKPALLVLFVAAFCAAYQQRTLRFIALFFMLPGLFCWFMWGAYQLRLGQHLIALAFFLIIARGYAYPFFLNKIGEARVPILISIFIGSLAFATAIGVREYNGVSLYAGERQSLQRYFGQDADKIYAKLSHPEICLWVPSRYLYGLFYKHTQLTTPDYLAYPTYDMASLADELRRKQPDYVFTVSEEVAHGHASMLLKALIVKCPASFSEFSNPQQRFSFITYQVDKKALQEDACLQRVAELNNKLS